ncbi:MAG: AAA family ATPase [Candidatus Thiodiazotropha sp. DIVDIV]
MFQDYFGIAEDPFSITPDPKYLFLSERHRNGFAHLLYGVTQGGGFVQLTGEVGTGKTLLCRKLLDRLPQAVDVAFIFNPRLSPLELVATICDELKVLYPLGCSSIKEIVDFLNAYLLETHAQGRRTVVIIDEAQNLSFESLEQIRLLTNLETASEKLLQIILVGQPELRALLKRPELRQLAQRITARYHLTPLSRTETRAYILHRLKVAGIERPLFTDAAIRRVYKLSGGIPRLINILCSRGMLAAFGKRKGQVTRGMLSQVASELRGEEDGVGRLKSWGWLLAGVSATLFVLALLPTINLYHLFASPSQEADLIAPSKPEETVSSPSAYQPLPTDLDAKARPVTDEMSLSTKYEGRSTQTADLNTETEVTRLDNGAGQQRSAFKASLPESQLIPSTSQGLAGLLGNENNAFTTLFSYWQVAYPMGGKDRTSCDKAEEVGLSCLFGRGSWKTLEYYNRPAILELLMESGQRYHVVVTGLRNQSVMLDLSGRRFSFTHQEIERLWTGGYIILWRPPELTTERLQMGHSGADVGWLISMLDRVEGIRSEYDPTKATFDQRLHNRVVRFQRDHELLADGIVGKQTLIQLNSSVNNLTMPTLLQDGG